MRFLRGLGSKKKYTNHDCSGRTFDNEQSQSRFVSKPPSRDWTARLPAPLLEKIFAAVCPHSRDETYEGCEQSAVDDACMLCDLRDLAHCAAISRRWRKLASNVLYYSIRIDPVHYCEREEMLAEKRKRRSFLNRNAEPEDTPSQRLKLLCRTLREDSSGLGLNVRFFKIPYMTREACKADLARTIAVLPKLRYVDLPEGFFTDDSTCTALKQELQARCPDIRKMAYMGGSERSLELLARGSIWRNLEVLELKNLNSDPGMLRYVLGALTSLRAMKIGDMEFLDDNFFKHSSNLPPFPALTELLLENISNISSTGILNYLSNPQAASTIRTFSFSGTGVLPSALQPILAAAPKLQHLFIIEQVSVSFPTASPAPLLSSPSLQTLHYEITAATQHNSYSSTTASYYAYLTSSLLAYGLPNLRQVYVRDQDFPESLLDFAPPMPAFALDSPKPAFQGSPNLSPNPFLRPDSVTSDFGSPPNSISRFTSNSNNPFASPSASLSPTMTAPITAGSMPINGNTKGPLRQELEVYTKCLEEMEWNFARVEPATRPGRRGSMTQLRPVSMYGLAASGGALSPSWSSAGFGGNDVRKSTVVGNGFGGYLAVPAEEFPGPGAGAGRRPSSSGDGGKRASKYDIWR